MPLNLVAHTARNNTVRCSKGEIKSKVTKSVRFSGGRWQASASTRSGIDTWIDRIEQIRFYSTQILAQMEEASLVYIFRARSFLFLLFLLYICTHHINWAITANHRRKRQCAWWKVCIFDKELGLWSSWSSLRWVRDGVFKFSFELRRYLSRARVEHQNSRLLAVTRSPTKTVLFNVKEANNHSFSWKVSDNAYHNVILRWKHPQTANWGW